MKRSNVKMLLFAAVAALGVTAVSMYSCEKETIVPNQELSEKASDKNLPVQGSICGKIVEKSLIDEKGRKVGTALFYNDTKYFYAHVTTEKNYLMENTYMHVCKDFSELPLSDKNVPMIENFNNSITGQGASPVRKIRVPLRDMSGQSFVAFATELVKVSNNSAEKTRVHYAWVEGKHFGVSGSGNVIIYKKNVCLENEPVSVNE